VSVLAVFSISPGCGLFSVILIMLANSPAKATELKNLDVLGSSIQRDTNGLYSGFVPRNGSSGSEERNGSMNLRTHDAVVQEKNVTANKSNTSPTIKKTNFRWTLAVFAGLMTLIAYLDRVNLAVATPAIMKDLHFTKVQIGTLQTVFFACYALAQVPSGTLTEFIGHRKVVALAITWWSVFTLRRSRRITQ
jgi:hypothetical protein